MWPEFVERFGTTERWREILAGLLRALPALKAAGCRHAYAGGSFVTSKEAPGDFDGHREAQKTKFAGEMFIADAPGNRFLEFFQLDRDGRPKGIIHVNLADIPS